MNKRLMFQLRYKLAERCSKNHAEQLAIAKALEKIQDFSHLQIHQGSVAIHRQENNVGCNSESQKSSKLSRANKR